VRIIVIGAGLTGLTAAFRLAPRHEVVVLEASARAGGQIFTAHERGFLIERGGEGFVARSEALPALARDAGLPATEVIGQAVLRSYGWDGEQLRALEPGQAAAQLGFQVPQEELGKGIRTLARGMGSVIEALEQRLRGRATVAFGVSAIAIEPRGRALAVATADGAEHVADAVIVATPAAAAAPLLRGLAGEAAAAIAQARTMSSVTVELAYARAAIAHPLDGSGVVVAAAAQQQGLRACTFSSSKFEGRAPTGMTSLRVFFRPTEEELRALDDAAWIARAEAGLQRLLPISGSPVATWVTRWPNALPVHDEAHKTAVAALEHALAAHAVKLAGSAFHGSGIDAAVRSAERAADAIETAG
jgi:protoporphyrinogen/coproporphyrinogen III oxidase